MFQMSFNISLDSLTSGLYQKTFFLSNFIKKGEIICSPPAFVYILWHLSFSDKIVQILILCLRNFFYHQFAAKCGQKINFETPLINQNLKILLERSELFHLQKSCKTALECIYKGNVSWKPFLGLFEEIAKYLN